MTILHYIPSIDEASGGVGAYMQLLTRDLGALKTGKNKDLLMI